MENLIMFLIVAYMISTFVFLGIHFSLMTYILGLSIEKKKSEKK